MTIQPAQIDDVPALVNLAQVLGYETDSSSLEKRVKEIIPRSDHCLLVAKTENEVIGFCHGYIRVLVEVDRAVEIGGLAVIPAWQGRGVAKKLVSAIEAWSLSQGITRVVLSSNIKRTQAHGFYEHLGYKNIKQQFAYEKQLS